MFDGVADGITLAVGVQVQAVAAVGVAVGVFLQEAAYGGIVKARAQLVLRRRAVVLLAGAAAAGKRRGLCRRLCRYSFPVQKTQLMKE
jgi:hypothetical protein